MSNRRLVIKYKCSCVVEEREVPVAERRDDEDVVAWVEYCQSALYIDHRLNSPDCRARSFDYMKIPAEDNAKGVGFAPPLDS